ncbi:MAG: aminomethyl transferase family protein [Chthoniobacterales bacterium]
MNNASTQTLEQKLQDCGNNPVEMLRHSQAGPYVFPIAAEFSNWYDEQLAWNETAVLFDLSHHMTDVYFEGPDVLRLLSDLAVNSFTTFGKGKAKQIVCCNPDGFVIGDAILFGLDDQKVNISGRPSVPNWVAYNAETGGYDVTVTRDDRTVSNACGRKTFRYQVQGPNSAALLTELCGGTLPDIKFFNICTLNIAGKTINGLNHGMARSGGLELFGPAEYGEVVRNEILRIGQAHGLRAAGARSYSTVSPESGWIPSPMPAIFTGEGMDAYRKWLKADGFEANASLGGSYYSDNIKDYYQTPWDLGYGRHVKFDHDFVGRSALEAMADRSHREKVWLIWNAADVQRIFASQFGTDEHFKRIEFPGAQYSTVPFDKVTADGKLVGLSTYNCYTANVRQMFSLAMIDQEHAADGTELTLIWGEEDGGSRKPTVERHVQTDVRVTVRTERPLISHHV